MNRRDFLKGLSAAVVTVQAAVAQGGTLTRSENAEVHFVHDTRCPAADDAIEKLGVKINRVYSIEGDVTDVWRDQLNTVWTRQNGLTAGVTRDAEFFVLKTLAQEQGYKVIHEEAAEDSVFWLLAPESRG